MRDNLPTLRLSFYSTIVNDIGQFVRNTIIRVVSYHEQLCFTVSSRRLSPLSNKKLTFDMYTRFSHQLYRAYVSLSYSRTNRYVSLLSTNCQRFLEITFIRPSASNRAYFQFCVVGFGDSLILRILISSESFCFCLLFTHIYYFVDMQ